MIFDKETIRNFEEAVKVIKANSKEENVIMNEVEVIKIQGELERLSDKIKEIANTRSFAYEVTELGDDGKNYTKNTDYDLAHDLAVEIVNILEKGGL